MAESQGKKAYRVVLASGKVETVTVPANFKPRVEASGALVFVALNDPSPYAACPPNGWHFFEPSQG